MDTRYLNYVLTIAKKENMTKAAEELYVSQSTLSQYLSKLESEIGTPLFYRSKGRLTLTPAGKLYVQAAEQVMSIKDNLYQNIQSLDNRGHITIGVTSQFGLRMLTEIIPAFKFQK
jgi:LysR family transcriptional activator of glutamate synthase operon